MLLSLMNGRKGMKAAFRLGRGLTPKLLITLCFEPGCKSPRHATLTEIQSRFDPVALASLFTRIIHAPHDIPYWLLFPGKLELPVPIVKIV